MNLEVRHELDPPIQLRDVDADYARSIDEAIATYTSLGREPTEHLLALKAEIAAHAALENKADDTALETAVPAPSAPARRRVKREHTAG